MMVVNSKLSSKNLSVTSAKKIYRLIQRKMPVFIFDVVLAHSTCNEKHFNKKIL